MSEFFRALEQAGRDRQEQLAKQRNEPKPSVTAEPPAQPKPEVAVVPTASKPRKEPRPDKPSAKSEPEVAVTSKPRNEPRPAVAAEPLAHVEPEVAVVTATIARAIETDVAPEIHAEVEAEIEAEVEPWLHTEVEAEIEAEVEPWLHAEVEARVEAEVETEFETAVETETAVAPTPAPFAMRSPEAPAFTESVPTVKDDDAESVNDRLVTLLTPNSFAGEQYRTLRHLVEKMHTDTGVSVVGISSPSIGDGKTTTAINLAGALAQARDTKVLLIDMDLRRPALNRQLGLRGFNPKGVVAVLGAGASLDDVIVELPMFNLSIIPSGPRQSAPYELLKSSRLHQMVDEARRRFDYVIIDTPPVIAVPDCRVISSGVDGFLIIVNAHKTPTRMLGETVSVLGQSKVLGLVFNRDDQPMAEHLYNSYGPDPNAGWTGAMRRRWRRNGHRHGNDHGHENSH